MTSWSRWDHRQAWDKAAEIGQPESRFLEVYEKQILKFSKKCRAGCAGIKCGKSFTRSEL